MSNYKDQISNKYQITKFQIWILVIVLVLGIWNLKLPTAHAGLILKTPSSLGLSTGLVGHWTFDGADVSVSRAFDKSGNGNTATISNFARSLGKIGQALDFNGSNTSMNAGTAASLDDIELQGGGGMTISVWIKPRTNGEAASTNMIAVKPDATDASGRWYLGINNSTLPLVFYKDYATQDLSVVTVQGVLSLNVWQHVVVTWNGGPTASTDVKFYVNNVLKSHSTDQNGTGTKNSDNLSSLYIASDLYGGRTMNSSVDDVRIYNRVLSTSEINRLYNMGAETHLSNVNTDSLTSGLVGHWTFDGNKMAGPLAYDSSNSFATGTIVTATRTIGRIGQAMNFNGASGYVSVTSDQLDDLDLQGGGGMTASAWVKPRTSGQTALSRIFGKESGPGGLYLMINGGTNSFKFVKDYDGASDLAVVVASNTIKYNAWQHVTVTWDGSATYATGVKIYINGTLATIDTSPVYTTDGAGNKVSDAENTMQIGNSNFVRTFDGAIDEVRIYNRVLSRNEIQRLYNMGGESKMGKTPTTSLTKGLKGHWTFDGNKMAGPLAYDSSNSLATGTITSAIKTIGKLGQAMEFNGTSGYVSVTSDQLDDLQLQGGGGMTASAWIYPHSVGENGQGLIFGKSAGSAGSWTVSLASTGRIGFVKDFDGASNLNPLSANGAYSFNKWQLVTVTWDGTGTSATGVKFYVNGVSGSNSWNQDGAGSAITDASNNFIIGNGAFDNFTFDGKIDDVRMFNRVLSASEVLQLYNMGR